jgi:beta-lactamase regulating signal transducer with metallopeptidase domain
MTSGPDFVLSAALAIAVKATLVVGAAAAAHAVLRRRSAAARHFVWTLAVAALLLLPALAAVLPAWTVAVRSVPADPVPVVVQPSAASAASPFQPIDAATPATATAVAQTPTTGRGVGLTTVVAIVYLTGLLVLTAHLLLQRRSVRRLLAAAVPVTDETWTALLAACARDIGVAREVRLLRSRERSMPMTVGTRRPAIVIPATADTWAGDRRRAVLLHELAHVARLDCLTQTLACAACAVHWFNPAAWWVARRLRIERELACDDRVIAVGTEPREYAGHLLEIAYAFDGGRAPALAVSMARPKQLEGRMLAVLDAARNRRLPGRRPRLAAVGMLAAVLVPLASVTPTAVEEPQSVERPAATSRDDGAPVMPDAVNQTMREWRGVAVEVRNAARAVSARWRHVTRSPAQTAKPATQSTPGRGAGSWQIDRSSTDGTVHLQLRDGRSSHGFSVRVDQLEGLSAAQLAGAGGPVQFRLRRDAGTFAFEGVVRNGAGGGAFTFAADQNFPAELAKRGFARPTASEQYDLALADIGYAFLDELTRQGYPKPGTSELVKAGHHGVNTTYLREMGALGLKLGTLEPLITLRDHGVTPDYVRGLAAHGYKGLSADQLRNARDHGVTPEYVAAMKEGGYGSLTMEQLITARDHGVDADYARALAAGGYRALPIDQLIRTRDHGGDAEYVREMQALGYKPALEDLVTARDHGVNAEYARALGALYKGVSLDTLIRLRDHGVNESFAREMKALGYELSPEDLVTLRDHGLTVERVKAANARAGTRLPVDMLVRLVNR